VVAVRHQCRTFEPAPGSRPYLGGDEVATAPNESRQGKHEESVGRLRIDDALESLIGGDTGRDEDRCDNRKAGVPLGSLGAKEEGSGKWHSGERVADVVDEVGEATLPVRTKIRA